MRENTVLTNTHWPASWPLTVHDLGAHLDTTDMLFMVSTDLPPASSYVKVTPAKAGFSATISVLRIPGIKAEASLQVLRGDISFFYWVLGT